MRSVDSLAELVATEVARFRSFVLIAHLQAPCEGLSCTANTLDALKQRISDRWCVPLPLANSVPEDATFHRRLITVVEYIAPVSAVIAAPARVVYDAPVGVYHHAPGMSLEASSDLSCKLGRHAVLRDVMACSDLPACTVQRAGIRRMFKALPEWKRL